MTIYCVFCEKSEIKERLIVENDCAWAFPTNIPVVPGHVLIVPKRCVVKFDDLLDDEILSIFDLVKKLKKSLNKTFNTGGFNYAWNEGKIAGQAVPHFHLHMLPRKEGDVGITQYDPRKFLYRPGSRAENSEKELIEIVKIIKENL